MADSTDPSRAWAARAAYVAAAMNFLSAGVMLLWLRPGLPVPGSLLEERMAYISGHGAAWKGGWLLWNLAALALLGFYLALAARWEDRFPLLCRLALVVATAGLAVDLAAEAIYAGVAPRLDSRGFAVAEVAAGVLTGFLGNGLYTLAGILLTCAGAFELPRHLLGLAILVWASGLGLSGASLLHSPPGQLWSTALLMPLFILWASLVGRWLKSRAP